MERKLERRQKKLEKKIAKPIEQVRVDLDYPMQQMENLNVNFKDNDVVSLVEQMQRSFGQTNFGDNPFETSIQLPHINHVSVQEAQDIIEDKISK